jgi:mannosidase alpha-like ER degradation enhancer 1
VEYLDVFQEAYAAIMRYARSPDGLWVRLFPLRLKFRLMGYHQFHSVAMSTGDRVYTTVDSLSSFWPGLQVRLSSFGCVPSHIGQVLAGDVENAIKSHLFCTIVLQARTIC